VQKVAEEDQLLARVTGKQGIESLKIGLGRTVGHGLAQSTVGGGLAEMDIGYQQRLLRRPVDGSLGKQPEFGLFQLDGQVRSHVRSLSRAAAGSHAPGGAGRATADL